ncbi:MAG: VCBS repeat-containing protein, partial [Deltaproteobacteria bacterium]|nr:VCBS repeat-containing protein [Deltaproteobacteria bacterium]
MRAPSSPPERGVWSEKETVMKHAILASVVCVTLVAPSAAVSPLFLDGTRSAGVGYRGNGKGAAFADYDNDGRWDLLVSNKGGGNVLYHNNGDGSFTDVTDKVGGNLRDGGFCMGSVFFDYDNDGWVDLFLPKGGRYEIESNRLL